MYIITASDSLDLEFFKQLNIITFVTSIKQKKSMKVAFLKTLVSKIIN